MVDVLMYSGGIDSWVAWYFLPEETKAVYVRLKHRYQDQEESSIMNLVDRFGGPIPEFVEGPNLGRFEEKDGNIPLRNAVLVMMGSYFLKDGGTVGLVTQYGEQSIPDRNMRFFSESGAYLSHLWDDGKVEVDPVFADLTKCELVKSYLDRGGSSEALLYCFSCLDSSSMPFFPSGCGRCGACFRKWIALVHNDVNGWESCFKSPPWKWNGAEKYRRRCEAGVYAPRRSEEILTVLHRFQGRATNHKTS